MPKYFGTDGIRGKIGEKPLNENFFVSLGAAIAQTYNLEKEYSNKIIFGCDTRESSERIISLISGHLIKEGYEIHNLGVVPTPAIPFYVKKNNYLLGIMISASHNPYFDNGVKIFSSNGIKINEKKELEIENNINLKINDVRNNKEYDLIEIKKTDRSEYIENCLSSIPKGISFKNFKIALDVANGSNYLVVPEVINKLGITADIINKSPNGKNINLKCGSTNIDTLKDYMRGKDFDIGISMDGDGDRVIIVDSELNTLDGDDILYILAKGKLKNREICDGVVGTLMSNLSLETSLKEKNIKFRRSAVGDKHVLDLLYETGWELGGEPSGHIISLDRSKTGDSVITMISVLYYLNILGEDVLEAKIKNKYPQKITNINLKFDIEEEEIKKIISSALSKKNIVDGESRFLIRKSGTEKLIRIMVESENQQKVDDITQILYNLIEKEMESIHGK